MYHGIEKRHYIENTRTSTCITIYARLHSTNTTMNTHGDGFTCSANGQISAQLQGLIDKHSTMSKDSWEQEVENFRCEFFGPNHEAIHFPTKLHKVVSCDVLFPDIFWMEDGKTFAIDRVGYQKHIMSIFFKQHTLKSFQNIVSRYGFKTAMTTNRFIDGDQVGDLIIYGHPLFVQGRADLSRGIDRVDQANTESSNQNLVPQGQINEEESALPTAEELSHVFDDIGVDISWPFIFDSVKANNATSNAQHQVNSTITVTTTTTTGTSVYPSPEVAERNQDSWASLFTTDDTSEPMVDLTPGETDQLLDMIRLQSTSGTSPTNDEDGIGDCSSISSALGIWMDCDTPRTAENK